MPVELFDFAQARERFGENYLSARVRAQSERAAKVLTAVGKRRLLPANMPWLHYIILKAFRWTGLHRPAYAGFKALRVVHNNVRLRELPSELEGHTILHLSDLHLDLDRSLTDVIIEKVTSCAYDTCVFTGDYRNNTHGDYDAAMEELTRLRKAITAPAYAILGNHDFIEMLSELERMDIHTLVNESVRLEHNGGSLCLVGVDDPNVYATDNIQKALESMEDVYPRILLAHSCSMFHRAAAHGVDLLLCGHTHGGQLCLPGGLPVLTADPCPRRMVRGAWTYEGMQGYTSPGTGSCAVPYRLFCPPEITLHHLQRAEPGETGEERL